MLRVIFAAGLVEDCCNKVSIARNKPALRKEACELTNEEKYSRSFRLIVSFIALPFYLFICILFASFIVSWLQREYLPI